MLNKHNLNIAKLAAKDESRYMVTGVRVSPEHTICTDGHQLTRVTTPKMGVDDFPAAEGFTAAAKWEPFILDAKAALAIAKAIPKSTTIPVLEHAAVGEATNDNGHAQIMVNDLESPQVFTPRKMDGQFPDYERVIPDKAKAAFTIGLNPLLLLSVLQAMKGFVNVKAPRMTLRFYDTDSAIRLDVSNDEQEWTSVLMPMRLDAAEKKPVSKPSTSFRAEPCARGGCRDLGRKATVGGHRARGSSAGGGGRARGVWNHCR